MRMGTLNLELSEMVRDYGGDATMPQAEEALGLVSTTRAAGVLAGPNLRECLLLQLNQDIPVPRYPPRPDLQPPG